MDTIVFSVHTDIQGVYACTVPGSWLFRSFQ